MQIYGFSWALTLSKAFKLYSRKVLEHLTMRAWAHRNYEKKSTKDFADKALLLPALEEKDLMAAGVAAKALAAAEIVAVALGKPELDFPEQMGPVVVELDLGEELELQEMAHDAVEAVFSESELKESWEESTSFATWQAVQQDLLTRLQ
jgi:hypothetical protein